MIEPLQRISEPSRCLKARYAAKGTLRRSMASLVKTSELAAPTWLSPREQSALAGLRDASRRDDWLLGRWLLKQLAAEAFFTDVRVVRSGNDRVALMRRMEFLPQTIDGLPTRPLMLVDGVAISGQVSLSHSAGGVLVAMIGQSATSLGVGVGVDLVASTRPSPGFVRTWFTDRERDSLHSRPELVMPYWGAKEATYKALHRGERFAPTAFEVTVSGDDDWWCRSRRHETLAKIAIRQVAPGTLAVLAYGNVEEPCANQSSQQRKSSAIYPLDESYCPSSLIHSQLIGIHS